VAKKRNLVGKTFGRLTVLRDSEEKNKWGSILWECLCSCGNLAKVRTSNLTGGITRSCGCINNERIAQIQKKDLRGQKFSRLTVLEDSGKRRKGRVVWLCRCDCGNLAEIPTSYLTSGKTKSCGCLKIEIAKARGKKFRFKHGYHKSRLYHIWSGMKQRCLNPKDPNYRYYGKKGVGVYDKWKDDFLAFRTWALQNGYAENLTIDRINSDENYKPSNCQWITKSKNSSKNYAPRPRNNKGQFLKSYIGER